MTAADLLLEFNHLGVKLWVDGEELRYDAPVNVLDAARREALRKHKAEIIALLRERRNGVDIGSGRIVPVSRDQPLPLSFAQRRVWFMGQLHPGNPFYNISLTVSLEGALDEAALRHSLDGLVRRHESLRTTYRHDGGEPFQIVHAAHSLALEFADLSGLEAGARDAEARCLATQESDRPFDLSTGPLLRGLLMRVKEQRHVLVLIVHHIAIDGWSAPILLRELGALYEAAVTGRSAELANLSVHYADFAAWQRQNLTDEALAASLAYWRARLADSPGTELATDRPRPAVQAFKAAAESIALNEELSAALRTLARAHRVTLFTVLLGVFHYLLSRYTGSDDVVTGVPTANRSHAEVENLIGFFVNSLVIRTDLSGDPTFAELLERVRDTLAGALAHEDLPFEKLAHELSGEANLNRNPLFQIMFTLHAGKAGSVRACGLRLELRWTEMLGTRLDLEFHAYDDGTRIGITCAYDTDLYEAETISRMLGYYQRLLGAVVEDPSRRMSELSLLDDRQRRRVVTDWNATTTTYPREASITALFEEQVARSPDGPAVVFGKESLTYAELAWRSGALASYLRELGVRRGTRVGVMTGRTLDYVVAVLGVLKAGGAFVPLDAGYPVERLDFMCKDAALEVLLTVSAERSRVPARVERVVCLDTDWETLSSRFDGQVVESVTVTTDPAYVIYTSGSTGGPKGVVGLHRGVVNRVSWMATAHPYSEGERCCHKTTVGFVDAVAELFGPLLAGVALEFFDAATSSDPRALVAAMGSRGVTRLVVVPSLLRAILELDGELLDAVPVRLWVSSGERLEASLERRFYARYPQAVLLNLYGSSEVSADVTCFDTRARGERAGALIGRPIANTRLYVLDAAKQPVPVGVTGELYVGGDGLAAGYLGQALLTAERFEPDPFVAGERLYRTGDRVRYQADGALEYLGRLDHQVKVRGYRIELGEIEALLAGHAEVHEAVVVCREDIPGDKRLVAYVAGGPGVELRASELRAYLRQRLPGFMVPAAFVAVNGLPLTPNGKVDREALPAPEGDRQVEVEFVEPRTEVEARLAEIWSEVLRSDRVGVNDDFFELGGHSLMAAQVISRVRSIFGVDLPVISVFEHRTVESLGARIVRVRWALGSLDRSGRRPEDGRREGVL